MLACVHCTHPCASDFLSRLGQASLKQVPFSEPKVYRGILAEARRLRLLKVEETRTVATVARPCHTHTFQETSNPGMFCQFFHVVATIHCGSPAFECSFFVFSCSQRGNNLKRGYRWFREDAAESWVLRRNRRFLLLVFLLVLRRQ